MGILTLGEASRICGRSKPSISAAIKSGRLPGKKVDGVYQILESYLLAYYPPRVPKRNSKSEHLGRGKLAGLKLEITILKREIESQSDRSSLLEEAVKSLTDKFDAVLALPVKSEAINDDTATQILKEEEIKQAEGKLRLWSLVEREANPKT